MAIKEKKEQKSKLVEILTKEYRWENYLFGAISILVLALGLLIVTGALTINANAWLIGGFPIVFGWILITLGAVTVLYAIFPFFKSAFPELRKISWLKGRKYLGNTIRVFTFLIIFALLFLLYDMFITEVLAAIMG